MSKKTVTPGHMIENPSGMAGIVLDDMLEEDSKVYAPDMAPLAAQPSPDTEIEQAAAVAAEAPAAKSEEVAGGAEATGGEDPAETPDATTNEEATAFTSELVTIALVKGATYRFRDGVFTKDTPVPVPASIAARLIATGFFEGR